MSKQNSEFWDYDENYGFTKIKSPDGLYYKVLNYGTIEDKIDVATILSNIRKDINKLLIYLCKNPQLWSSKPIGWGIVHTFDIHIPGWDKIPDLNKITLNSFDEMFNYQEMPTNYDGIIGLNKPKKIITIKSKFGDFEIAGKRSIFLTIRNQITGKINDYGKILDLAIHELTHTACNDIRWKEDNHTPPYRSYHTLIRKWAKDINIIKINL